MVSLPTCTFPVRKSPTEATALQDVVSYHPGESEKIQEGFFCSLQTEEGKLHLPLKADARVKVGTVGLNALQRKTLQCALNEKIQITLIDKDIFPRVSKVWITILARRNSGEKVYTREIVRQFKKKFHAHPLNKGHILPLKINDTVFCITVDNMAAFSEESKGIMKGDCTVVPKFRVGFDDKPKDW